MSVNWSEGVPLMAGPYQVGLYDPSPETVGYWEGLKADKLMIKRCAGCQRYHHPRRLFCFACGSDRFDWVEASGKGSVYTFSTVHRSPREEFASEVPYTVGLLQLAEGIFFFSRILHKPGGEVRLGAQARMEFKEVGPSGRLPVFQIID